MGNFFTQKKVVAFGKIGVTFFVVASYAESRLSQGNLNQPDMAFCFMSAAIS
jgi:hypothetical protein